MLYSITLSACLSPYSSTVLSRVARCTCPPPSPANAARYRTYTAPHAGSQHHYPYTPLRPQPPSAIHTHATCSPSPCFLFLFLFDFLSRCWNNDICDKAAPAPYTFFTPPETPTFHCPHDLLLPAQDIKAQPTHAVPATSPPPSHQTPAAPHRKPPKPSSTA